MDETYLEQLKIRYEQVQQKILATSQKSGRDQKSISLVVVTKTQPVDHISAAIQAGLHNFGENYADEAVEKIASISGSNRITWHMIGHIQSRKAETVARVFDYVHSVDSVKLAQRLDKFAKENKRKIPILLECNVSGEETKFGFAAFQEIQWPLLLPEIEQIAELPNLQICGLMTMPPLFENAEDTRPYFQMLRKLRKYFSAQFRSIEWGELSMGTSSDFCTAIEEGATIIRIGTAIMGHRPLKL